MHYDPFALGEWLTRMLRHKGTILPREDPAIMQFLEETIGSRPGHSAWPAYRSGQRYRVAERIHHRISTAIARDIPTLARGADEILIGLGAARTPRVLDSGGAALDERPLFCYVRKDAQFAFARAELPDDERTTIDPPSNRTGTLRGRLDPRVARELLERHCELQTARYATPFRLGLKKDLYL